MNEGILYSLNEILNFRKAIITVIHKLEKKNKYDKQAQRFYRITDFAACTIYDKLEQALTKEEQIAPTKEPAKTHKK